MCASKDLALLQIIDCPNMKSTPIFRDLISNPLIKDEPIFIIGNSEDFTFKQGTVLEACHKDSLVCLTSEFVLINMDVKAGDSGSALFDAKGQIIGIVRKTSTVNPNQAYAITATEVTRILTEDWGIRIQQK